MKTRGAVEVYLIYLLAAGLVTAGAGQSMEIRSNLTTQVTLTGTLATAPGATSTYVIQDTPTSDGLHPNNSTHDILASALSVFAANV